MRKIRKEDLNLAYYMICYRCNKFIHDYSYPKPEIKSALNKFNKNRWRKINGRNVCGECLTKDEKEIVKGYG